MPQRYLKGTSEMVLCICNFQIHNILIMSFSLTQQCSWITENLSQKSHTPFLPISNLKHFQPVSALWEQPLSVSEIEISMDVAVSSRTRQHIHIKRRTRNSSRGFPWWKRSFAKILTGWGWNFLKEPPLFDDGCTKKHNNKLGKCSIWSVRSVSV